MRGDAMLNEQTFEKLYSLKLVGMAEAWKDQMARPDMDGLAFEERFALLVDAQCLFRENKRMKRLLENAKLKLSTSLEDIDYRAPRGLDKSVIRSLGTCDWIRKHQNVIIVGPTGTGKTYLACALAHKACREGLGAFYVRTPTRSMTPWPWLTRTVAMQGPSRSWAGCRFSSSINVERSVMLRTTFISLTYQVLPWCITSHF
jgi:DNA replication protein DnaC